MLFESRGHGARAGKRGFTLVELLVVIGIIAVLIGILMPVLGRAREQGRNARCLSNLRQIGAAMNLYSAENKGFIVPGSVQWFDPGPKAGRGESSWATLLVSLKYITATSQLELSGAGTPPAEEVYQNEMSFGDSVFRCPSGADRKGNVGSNSGLAVSKTDPENDGFWRRQDFLFHGGGNASQANGVMIDTWYAINGVQPDTQAEMNDPNFQAPFPMRVIARSRTTAPGRISGGPLSRVTQIRKSSDMAMIFDGLRAHNYNTNNISARHSGKRQANVLFADWHAESIDISALPEGKDATSQLLSADLLSNNNKSHPMWRLDQVR
jgi:prepilin-type N-terminal cleavage/methylation domain-containing protein/prepilin-type processing-associated H-X9-DG protein